jgi:hypothetical protein
MLTGTLADGEHVLGPARAPQDSGAAKLALPLRDCPVIVHDVEINPGVRVYQCNVLDGSRHGDVDVQIEIGQAVMGRSCLGELGQEESGPGDNY